MTNQALQKLAIHGGTPARQPGSGSSFPASAMIDHEEEEAVLEVIRSKRLYRYAGPTGTSNVDLLEQNFAVHTGVNHALAVTSGTAALICALQGIGIGPGDEVIVPAYTWMATATAVMTVGAVPIVAEVDETLTLDPVDVEAKVSPYTRAIAVVHMRGAPSRMDELLAVAQKHNLKVVEDTAQANGGFYDGKRLGTLGDVGAFSLQLSKIITSGEGGIVITDDETIWKRALMFHDVPASLRNEIAPEEAVWGINFRMPEISAALAVVQLKRINRVLADMRARKEMLKSGMQDVAKRKGITFREIADPEGDTGATLIFFAEKVETANRLAEALRAENIGASTLYHPDHADHHVYAHWTGMLEKRTWTPNGGPWRWAHRDIEYSRDMCPRSLDLLGRAIHIGVDPLMTNEEVEETLDGINRVIEVLA